MTTIKKGHARFAATIGAAALLAVTLSSCTSASGEGSTVDTGTIGGAAAGGLVGPLVSKNPFVIGGLAVAGGIAGNEFIDKPRGEEAPKGRRGTPGREGAGKAHGRYQGPVDGIIGPATEETVRRFEAKQGRAETGRLTPALMSQMRATL